MTDAEPSESLESAICPACGGEVEHDQFNGRCVDGEIWHRACMVEKDGYRRIDDPADAPRCSNCRGEFTHRRERDEFPIPDAEGKIVDYACTTFLNKMERVTVETPVREFTDDDWDFLESVAGTDHWFSEWASRIHPDLEVHQ